MYLQHLNINILSVLKINSMITDINSVVNLSANDEVELDIKYTNSNKNIQAGDEVTDEVLGISEIDECEEITKSSIEFEAINVLDATKKLTEEYKSKNTFRYVKDGI